MGNGKFRERVKISTSKFPHLEKERDKVMAIKLIVGGYD